MQIRLCSHLEATRAPELEGVALAERTRGANVMKTPQLLTTALALALAATAACNRADASREANEAAAEVRRAAGVAGDRLADGWLTAKVQAKYFADDDIKARYIDVSSRDGTVTLKGFVENEAVRQEALRIARETEGVARVDDQLLLGQAPQTAAASTGSSPATPAPEAVGTTGASGSPAPGTAIDDATVTSLVQAKYFLDPGIKARSIDVSTRNGIVTLRGQVASDNERAQALLLARTTLGVERVEDGLAIDASLAPPAPSASTGSTPLPSGRIAGAGTAAPAATPPAAGASAAGSTAVGTSGARAADTTVETAIKSKLSRDAQLKGIEVSARDGVVLLQGTVASQATKQRALTAARETEGVMQVVDRLSVKGK
jgi:hyperosmotically inducible protein